MVRLMSERVDLIARCRKLEQRFIRLGQPIGAQWANQWAISMLDSRVPFALYANWIEQQEARADLYERIAA
jgi:hypothetical protein